MTQASLRSFFFGSEQITSPCAQLTEHQLTRPEGSRRYRLAQPSKGATGLRPLVILLHGFGATSAQLLGQSFPPSPLSRWLEIAEREQWLVAAPDGTNKSWNDGFADASVNAKTDDTGFIAALIDELVATRGADPERVYLMGVSKGGMMAFHLAAELGTRLTAFAAVLASMPANNRAALPRTPLSALVIASDTDPLVRYAGGSYWYTRRRGGAMLGVEASVAVWRQLAGLTGAPMQTDIPPRASGGSTRATRLLWGADPQALQVGLIRIAGGGHAEPSPSRRYPRWINWLTGAQNGDFETADAAWDFFKNKRRG